MLLHQHYLGKEISYQAQQIRLSASGFIKRKDDRTTRCLLSISILCLPDVPWSLIAMRLNPRGWGGRVDLWQLPLSVSPFWSLWLACRNSKRHKCAYSVDIGLRTLRTLDTSDPRQFGTMSLVPKCLTFFLPVPMCLWDTSAPVPNCLNIL